MGLEVLRKMPEAAELPVAPANKPSFKAPNLKAIDGTLKGPPTPTSREMVTLIIDNTHGGITPPEPLWPKGVIGPDQRDIDEVNGPEKLPIPRVTTIPQFREALADSTNPHPSTKKRLEAQVLADRYRNEHPDVPTTKKKHPGVKPESEQVKPETETKPTTGSTIADENKPLRLLKDQKGQIHPEIPLRIAGVLGTVGLVVAGFWGMITDVLKPKPGATPAPTPIVRPSPTGGMPSASASIAIESPSPTASASASASAKPSQPESTPTPDTSKWWNEIPPNPYTNPKDVPIPKDVNGHSIEGDLLLEGVPSNYFVQADMLTILSATPDIDNNQIKVKALLYNNDKTGAYTVEQKKCSGTCFEELTGGIIELIIFPTPVDKLSDLARQLNAGASMSGTIGLNQSKMGESAGLTSSMLATNRNSLSKYRSKLGVKDAFDPTSPADLPSFYVILDKIYQSTN